METLREGITTGSKRMQRKIVVVYYDPAWAEAFNREADLIRQIFGDSLIGLHHIGSTAIPGMSAKPIIDMLAETEDILRIDSQLKRLQHAGYQPSNENGGENRRFFTKDTNGSRSHHLHVHQSGDPQIEDHLNFRDYLSAHPRAAEKYAELKRSLANQFPEQIDQYINGKLSFIQKTFREARLWKGSGNPI